MKVEDSKQILEDYTSGISIAKIKEKYGLTGVGLGRVLERFNIPTRPTRKARAYPRNRSGVTKKRYTKIPDEFKDDFPEGATLEWTREEDGIKVFAINPTSKRKRK